MNTHKKRKLLIKENFQIKFITSFIFLLFIEIIVTTLCVYQLSYQALEKSAFKSHIAIANTAQIIGPVILKVNLCAIILISFIAGIIIIFAYSRLKELLGRIITGIDNLTRNNTAFRIQTRGRKNEEISREFNQAAAYLDNQQHDLRQILNALLVETEIRNIAELHKKLYAIITGKKSG